MLTSLILKSLFTYWVQISNETPLDAICLSDSGGLHMGDLVLTLFWGRHKPRGGIPLIGVWKKNLGTARSVFTVYSIQISSQVDKRCLYWLYTTNYLNGCRVVNLNIREQLTTTVKTLSYDYWETSFYFVFENKYYKHLET